MTTSILTNDRALLVAPKIRIYPTRNPDTGATVFRWVISVSGQWAAGGYCATREDARNDASIAARSVRNAGENTQS